MNRSVQSDVQSDDVGEASYVRDGEASRLREVLTRGPVLVNIQRGPDHTFDFVHPLMREIVEGRDILGLPLRDAMPEWTDQGIFELFDEVYTTGETRTGSEVPALVDRGTSPREAYFNFTFQPMRGPGDVIEGVVTFAVDVTEQVLARKQGEAVVERMRQEEQFRDLFMGVLSHDLRGPLSSVIAGASLVMHGNGLSEMQEKTLHRVLASADRMTRMIEQVLDLTRTRLGDGIPMMPRTTDLSTIVHGICEELGSAHPDAKIVVEADSACLGEWDPDRLAQVVSNLLGNAIVHAAPGTLITVRVASAENVATLSVHNLGSAIPASQCATIFDPFKRAASHRNGQGLGLGLYIAQELALAHGGDISVTSDSATGTTFTVRLPLALE